MIILQILTDSGALILSYLPYVLIGILLSEILKYTSWTQIIRRAITGAPLFSVGAAAILGILSPLSTYGTVPIVIGLFTAGVPLAPLVSFLSASSLMNPQLFVITWASLGGDFAFLRLVGITVFTMITGYAIMIFERRQGSLSLIGVNERLNHHNSGNVEKSWSDFNLSSFLRSYMGNLEFIGYYLVLGIVVSVTVEAIIPLDTLLQMTGDLQWLNVLAASILGIPMYVCGGAVIPMLQKLMANGMGQGAAIAFLIVGPGTRVTALMALGSFLTRRMLAVYVVFLLSFSMVLGIMTNAVLG